MSDDGTERLIHKPTSPLEWLMQRPYEDEPTEYNLDLDLVAEAWSQLPLDESDIIQAVFHERLSYEELGERLGCSKPHAWRRTQQALEHLRSILGSLDPEIEQRYQ